MPYASLLHPTKDIMHTANNSIKDSLKVFKRSTTSQPAFENRTTKDSVVASCREYKIFPFMTRPIDPQWPWILSNNYILQHDNRLKNILGNYFSRFSVLLFFTTIYYFLLLFTIFYYFLLFFTVFYCFLQEFTNLLIY